MGARIGAAVLIALACVLSACTTGARTGTSGVAGEASRSTEGTAAGGVLRVAVAGMVTPEEGKQYYEGVAGYVAAKAGRELRLVHKSDYAQVNEMLEQHRLDMAFVCSGPYVSGHDAFGMELLVAPQVNGAARYYSYIIVPRGSDATSMASLKGKAFAFADPQSNTGCLVPTYMLARMGTTPKDFFGRMFYTYSHDNSIKAVATGKADGAAVDSLIYDYEVSRGSTLTAETRILVKSEPFAIPPVVVDPALDPAVKATLRDAFLGLDKDPAGAKLLRKMQIERFVPIKDAEYDSIRRMNEWVAKQRKG